MRGAGNLLGGEQHGHINSVGFDTYVRLLEETVRELKGEEIVPEIHSALNLGLDIRIPPDYIADENQRLRAYRQIASAADAEARDRAEKELEDRYGPVPEAVRNLLEYSALKTLAEQIGIEAVDRRHNLLNIKFHKETRVDPERLMGIVAKTPRRAVHSGRRLATTAGRADRRRRHPAVFGREIDGAERRSRVSDSTSLRSGMPWGPSC